MVASLCAFPPAAAAQQGLTLGANAIFYGDNTEFRNPFREGETIFGAAARVDGRIDLAATAALTLGVFGNQRFGSEDAFERVRPVIALTVSRRRSTFVFGTLPAAFERRGPAGVRGAGPDRAGPHGLVPALQRETLAFDRPYEAGLQWTFGGTRWDHDAWLNWQRLNTAAHRERFDAGARGSWRPAAVVRVPVEVHVVHEGGQLFAAGPVRDSAAAGAGVALSNRSTPAPAGPSAAPSPVFTLELLGFVSRYTPDREVPDPALQGAAFFGRAQIEGRGWRGHLIMWRGDDFVTDEGDPNYLAVRRDGTRWRGIRDYAEAGVARTFSLAPGTWLEASFRVHRTERHYEYSYRILAVADVRRRVH